MSWDWEKLQQQKQSQRGQGGGMPPDIDDIIKKVKEIKLPGSSLLIILLAIVILFGSSMIFKINLDEVGVIQRFGKYRREAQPGLNFKWPIGIEKLTKVKVTYVDKQEFGLKTAFAGDAPFSTVGDDVSESLMLTGDLNVAVVPWIVRYKVKDPYKYLFKVDDVKKLLQDMSEASMRLVVGDRSINEVISKREEIADEAKILLQAEMDKAEAGISIVGVEMKKTNVPGPVQPSFNEVNKATQEKEEMIYQAKEDYNKAIPAAKGEAERTIRGAEGYALERINAAKGDAARFDALYAEYSKAKDVTKRRLYLEMAKEIFPKLEDKYILDSNQKTILPLLNLGKENSVLK